MFTYLFCRFLWRVFSLLRADELYVIFSSGLKVWVLLLVQVSFHFFYPEFGVRFAPICSRWPLFQNWFFFTLFPLTGRRCHFLFRVLANHFASIFLLPLSGDSFGLLYVPVPHSLPIRSQNANICWFPFWPGFVTWGIDLYYYPVLMVILWVAC